VNQLSHICPISDDEAARALSREALADLAERIMAVPVSGGRARPRRAHRRRWLAPVALAGALAGALLIVSSVGNLGGGLGPGSAAALSFTTRGGFIEVIVRNPLADPTRYRAELAAHNIDIKLSLVPASPSIVGTVAAIVTDSRDKIRTITAVGKCWTGGAGGATCPVGVRIPIGFHGSAEVAFGRAARPGERYQTTWDDATAPGEALHGLRISGRPVAAVLSMLSARHVTAPQYRHTIPTGTTSEGTAGFTEALRPGQVPPTWHVYGATPWAPGEVLLWVGPSPTPPQ
jgi:hypothetical protein